MQLAPLTKHNGTDRKTYSQISGGILSARNEQYRVK